MSESQSVAETVRRRLIRPVGTIRTRLHVNGCYSLQLCHSESLFTVRRVFVHCTLYQRHTKAQVAGGPSARLSHWKGPSSSPFGRPWSSRSPVRPEGEELGDFLGHGRFGTGDDRGTATRACETGGWDGLGERGCLQEVSGVKNDGRTAEVGS